MGIVVGGIADVHPVAKVCTKILGVSSAQELACVMTATGLAQNYSAIIVFATEGIQKMIEEKKNSFDRAKELLEQI